ncbi:tetratricopeptide repeat protein [Ramlibacter albus]|uniref:Tetratricopeptide repeat protein n=1 Tax=Ramlibacter albus TaxID=2079448 RepID=A0A923M5S1_9BURK|nr:tetratricopeptide repeat protein [Ramlibacter albus]MBC5764742.1 tetratricopeptide repeat protein [Ramlibacter albus]
MLLFAACAQAADCRAPDTAGDETTLNLLVQRVPDCQRDAAFLAALGHFLNERGRYVEAADHLERALLLEPGFKGAQVDYAIALAGVGDLASALSLVENLLAESDLPPALRPVLERQRAGWTRGSGTQMRLVLNTRVGYDSNLLGTPNLTSLALTFPGQTVVLPLDESYKRKGGIYGRVDLQLEARRDSGQYGQWDAFVGLRSRRSGAVADVGSDQLDLALQYNNYQRAPGRRGFFAGASTSVLHARTGLNYRARSLVAGLGATRAASGCDGRLGLDLQERDYLNNPVLSGRYSGFSLNWTCDGSRRVQWLASVRAGVDRARDPQRPGGDQHQYSARGAAVWTGVGLGERPQGQVLVDAELSVSRDRTSYSPLLESGRLREVKRSTLRAEYQYPVSRSLQLLVGTEWAVQRSAIVLFSSRSWGPYVALRSTW